MEDEPPPSAPRTDDADEAKQQQRSSVPNEDDAAAGAPASQQQDDQPPVYEDDTKPTSKPKKQDDQPPSSDDATMEAPVSKPQDASGDADLSNDNGPAKLKGEAQDEAQDVTDALVNAKREKVDSVKKDAAKDHASSPKKKRAKAKDGAPKAKQMTGGDTKKRKAKDAGDKDTPSKKKAGGANGSPKKRAKTSSKGTAKKKPTVEHGYIGVTSRVGVAVQDIGMPFSGGYTRRRVQHVASIKRGGREYSLGAFELAADAALAHDAAYRITADDGHGGALANNDAKGLQRALGWLDQKPKKKGKGKVEEEGVNFRRPAEYRAARKKELKDSGLTTDVVPTEEGLKILIGKEVLNLAKTYVATRSKVEEGAIADPSEQSEDGSEPQTKKRKKVASSLSKKKAWTPDYNSGDNEDDVKVQAEMLLSLQNKSVGVNKKDALARRLEQMMAGGEGEESPEPVAASSGASNSVLASSTGLSQSLVGLRGGQSDANTLQHALLLFQQRQAALHQQRALEEQLMMVASRKADLRLARLEMSVRDSVGAMFQPPAESKLEAEKKSGPETKPEAETKDEVETKSKADADNGDDDEDAKVKSLLAKMGFKGPVLPGLAEQLKVALKENRVLDIVSTDALDGKDDDPKAARKRRALKEAKREALAQKLSVMMGGGSNGATNVESSGAEGDDKGEASAPNLQRQQAVQLQALHSLQGLSGGGTSAGVGEHSLMQSLLLKKQLAEMNKVALQQKITSSLDDLALPQGLQSIREQQPADSQTTGDDALMEEAVRRRVMLELRSQLGGGPYLGAAPGLGSGMTFGAERAARMTNAELRRALMLSQMQAAAVEQRLELERRSREIWQPASTAKNPSSPLDALVEAARKTGDEAD
ncbi:hypothetical protein ACHAXT_000741 [Thalassiosira profunda]